MYFELNLFCLEPDIATQQVGQGKEFKSKGDRTLRESLVCV